MASYQGHRSWAAWNVSLWLNNDEGLYRAMVRFSKRHTRDEAAKLMLAYVQESYGYLTPDGARYTVSSIREAMKGI